jgi:hypothetical protein
MSSAISRGLVGTETLLPVGDVELCVDTVGSPTDIPLLRAELPSRAHAKVARAVLAHTAQ